MSCVEVSIILPAHNEAYRIKDTIKKIQEEMNKIGYSYEIIIAEDGSSDNTLEIVKKLIKKDKKIRLIHFEKRLGRGKALTNAIKKANGKICVYMNVDLSTDLKYLKN